MGSTVSIEVRIGGDYATIEDDTGRIVAVYAHTRGIPAVMVAPDTGTADKMMNRALSLVGDSLLKHGGGSLITAYLENRGVAYSIVTKPKEDDHREDFQREVSLVGP